LRHLVETMASVSRYRDFRRADARFHFTIASAARSRRLMAAETSIQAEIADLLALIPHPAEALRLSNGQHRAILEAISQRNADQARALTEAHVHGTGDFLVGLRLGRVE
jgi:DNA-binding GntR family transcriptional regulator